MQILSGILQSPYLRIGANYHHERYDGRGYPEGLKGEDIPDIARIIAVADAYDAMTSRRSYRKPIPQQLVREELVKGIGTQFDPNYAMIMIHLIDLDSEYKMKEHEEVNEFETIGTLVCVSYRSAVSNGVLLSNTVTHIEMTYYVNDKKHDPESIPVLLLYDSLDARIHKDERKCRELQYLEYVSISADGKVKPSGIRNIRIQTNENLGSAAESKAIQNSEKIHLAIDAVSIADQLDLLLLFV